MIKYTSLDIYVYQYEEYINQFLHTNNVHPTDVVSIQVETSPMDDGFNLKRIHIFYRK